MCLRVYQTGYGERDGRGGEKGVLLNPAQTGSTLRTQCHFFEIGEKRKKGRTGGKERAWKIKSLEKQYLLLPRNLAPMEKRNTGTSPTLQHPVSHASGLDTVMLPAETPDAGTLSRQCSCTTRHGSTERRDFHLEGTIFGSQKTGPLCL